MLRFHQQRCESVDDLLRPYNSCSYAWDEPCLPKKLVVQVPGGGGPIGTFSLDEVKDYTAVTLPASIKVIIPLPLSDLVQLPCPPPCPCFFPPFIN